MINNLFAPVLAFSTVPVRKSVRVKTHSTSLFASSPKRNSAAIETTRRNVLNSVFPSVLAAQLMVQATSAPPAYASGGATAGGAYLLSAKQRYNERVTAGVKSFLSLSSSLENGDLSSTVSFFTSEEQGGWKDFSSAGYLLSNAFRRSSTTPPDSLPSVQKWKAFAAQVEGMQKAIKKKSKSGVSKAYAEGLAMLDAYLDAVELPPSAEL